MSLEKLMSKEIEVKDIFTLVRQTMSIFFTLFHKQQNYSTFVII